MFSGNFFVSDCNDYVSLKGESAFALGATNVAGASIGSLGTVWKYRNYKGHMQKRLWSLEQKKWLTEWENI